MRNFESVLQTKRIDEKDIKNISKLCKSRFFDYGIEPRTYERKQNFEEMEKMDYSIC